MQYSRLFITIFSTWMLLACTPVPDEPASAGMSSAQDQASLAWPALMEASGTTIQKEETGGTAPIVVPATPTSIRFDWENREMMTDFAGSCPPLIAPLAGSQGEGCSYYFSSGYQPGGESIDNKLYYVYTDQKMTDADPSDEQSCCVIEGFPMLSRYFPEYIQQFNNYMAAEPPNGTGTACHPPTLPYPHASLGTPGGGYYAYDPDSTLKHGDESWVMPLGFGGVTPGEVFTALEYDQAIAFPAAIAEIGLPAACSAQDVPACRSCAAETGPCDGPELTDVFAILEKPDKGGCVLCHNTFATPAFPEDLMQQFPPGDC